MARTTPAAANEAMVVTRVQKVTEGKIRLKHTCHCLTSK